MNNPTAGITAVILASGFSKRMGCNKLLLPVEGKAMIAHVFDAVRQVEFEQTVVVTGFDRRHVDVGVDVGMTCCKVSF